MGRPPLFDDQEQMAAAIDSYFSRCEADQRPVTVSGLAYELGMTTETLRAYGEKDKFSATVKRAKQRVEIALEERLDAQSCTGAIFNLKNNFGWKDKREQESSLSPELMQLVQRLEGMTDEQLEAMDGEL